MATVDIQLGEFLPAAPSFKNPGCVVADNVIPSAGGAYSPFPSPSGLGQSVSGAVKGALQLYNNNGDSAIVGGTDTALFIRNTAIDETTGYVPLGQNEAWDFTQYNNFIIATGNNNSPQYLSNVNTDTSWSDLPGSPPQAKRCARVGDFLVLGNEPTAASRITWSSFNNPTASWAPDRISQSGNATLPIHLGAIQRIIGGRYATIFQERGVIRLTYVGPPTVWRVDIVSEDRGATAPNAVVDVGYQSYFLSQDGFYVTNGSEFSQIGNDRVNGWFFDNIEQAEIRNVHGTVDWENGSIVWAFRGVNSAGYNRLIMYSWLFNRWSTATIPTDWIVSSAADGVSLDDLDATVPNLDASLVSLDSPVYRSGNRRLAAFTDNGAGGSEYSIFNGEALEATWETGEFEPSAAQRVFVSEMYPVMEAELWDVQGSAITRDNRGGEVSSPLRTAGWGGFCAIRGEGQKVRIKMVKPAGTDWSRAQGVQITYQPAGMR